MRRQTIVRAAALVAFVPALAFAQRGGGGGGGRGRGGGGSEVARDPGLVIPRLVNPLNLLIEHRQAVGLNDEQFKNVVSIKRSVDSANVPLNRRLDSLQRVFRGGSMLFGSPSAERRDSLAQAKAVVQETETSVRANISEGRDKAYGLLSASQLVKAQSFEDDAQRALADEEKAKGRGG